MFFIILASILASFSIGFGLKWWFDKNDPYLKITLKEFVVTASTIAVIVIPAVSLVGWKMARNSRTNFTEFRNGWETEANWTVIQCHRDGRCYHHYSCDPYIVMVPYTYSCGKSTCTGVRAETRYHQCPYTTQEWGFDIQSTLGEVFEDGGRFPDNPENYRWRAGVGVPDRPDNTGKPPLWVDARNRIANRVPGPVTKQFSYENYILVSDKTILKKYSDEISRYKSLKLLPSIPTDVVQFYKVRNLFVVGKVKINSFEWDEKLFYLNGELGYARNGNMILIITNHSIIDQNPEQYKLTLQAYWQKYQLFGKNALPKNSLVVILGTDNQTVKWVKTFTAMPSGNEYLMSRIRTELINKPLQSDTIVGQTIANVVNGHRKVTSNLGLSQLTVSNPETKFKRAEMKYYAYLKNQIEPTSGQKKAIAVVVILLSSLLWLVPLMNDIFGEGYTSNYRRYYR